MCQKYRKLRITAPHKDVSHRTRPSSTAQCRFWAASKKYTKQAMSRIATRKESCICRAVACRSTHADAIVTAHAPICSTCMRAQCNIVSGKDTRHGPTHRSKALIGHARRRVYAPLKNACTTQKLQAKEWRTFGRLVPEASMRTSLANTHALRPVSATQLASAKLTRRGRHSPTPNYKQSFQPAPTTRAHDPKRRPRAGSRSVSGHPGQQTV